MPTTSARTSQHGITLIEALITFLVLALGMLALAQAPKQLRLKAEVARQRGEAVRLAQSEIEALRALPGEPLTPANRSVDINGTRYLLARRVSIDAATRVTIDIAWTDRSDTAQTMTLGTIVAGGPPGLAAAFGLARTEALARGAAGRSPRVPLLAVDLGDGRSALKPVASGTVALLLSNVTGQVVGRCAAVDPSLATRDLTRANLGTCDAVAGLLISGSVRFTAAAAPDAAQANDAPLPFTMTARPTTGTDPAAATCASEALKTVAYDRNGQRQRQAVPLAATPASLGLTAWTETGERYASYHCVVYPRASAGWSGRTDLQPSGWSIAAAAGAWRVCRFAHDLDGSGAVDANPEHPANYIALNTSLAQQNFLVITGTSPCPPGNNSGLAVDLSTAAHQP